MVGSVEAFPPAPPRPPEKILEVPVAAEQWRLKDLSHIRIGKLGLIRNPKKDVLTIYVLKGPPPVRVKLSLRSRIPKHKGNCFLVSHFDKGATNRLGGYYNRFQRKPSLADAAVRPNHARVGALILKFQRKSTGFCGMWMHFFNFKQDPRQRFFLNAQPFSQLTFWIRGQKGGEQILLKMADAAWERKGDALAVGALNRFLPKKRITTEWQRVVVPLRAFPKSLNRRMLASWVLEATKGSGQIEVKTMAFCRKPFPLPKLPPMPKSKPPILVVRPRLRQRAGFVVSTPKIKVARLRKSTWLWETARYLKSPRKQRELVQFLTKHKFDSVFLQTPHNPRTLQTQSPPVLHVGQWRTLLAALHRHNIRVYALDGYKKYALPPWHSRVLEVAQRVVVYNQSVRVHERFDGLHFDIEPYLMSSLWSSRRQWVGAQYLTILSKLTALAHRHQMTFGADIPFWFDAKDPYTTQGFVISYGGVAKPLHQHVIDIVDRVGIMDYRTSVFGADGVLSHGMGELTCASRKNKQILIGLETLPLPKEFLFHFKGAAKKGWPDVSGTHPARSFVFLVPPQRLGPTKAIATAKKTPTVQTKTVASRIVGAVAAQSPPAMMHGTLAWVPSYRLRKWRLLLQQRKVPWQQIRYWPVHRTVYISPDKLSFAGLGASLLHRALHDLNRELRRFSAFTGFAIHSIHSYKKLLLQRRSEH